MSHWAEEYLTQLTDCEDRSDRLTPWECGFVDSLRRQIEVNEIRPTLKQEETLDAIWNRVTARG